MLIFTDRKTNKQTKHQETAHFDSTTQHQQTKRNGK